MENWMNLPGPEYKALRIAEEKGIVEYTIEGNYMLWEERWFDGAEWKTHIQKYDLFNDSKEWS